MEEVKGILYGVSVGPGDPELLTLKAVRVLEACPVIAAPQTGGEKTLALEIARGAVNLEGKTILELPFAMQRDRAKLEAAHAAAAEAIRAHLDAGRDVAMPNLGDVSIYSTFSYLMKRLGDEGYETVMIPGVPSFCAIAARLGISLTTMNAPLHIIPAGPRLTAEELTQPGTKVLMKSASNLNGVLDLLKENDLLEKAALVRDCGLPTEQVYTDLAHDDVQPGYFSTFIVKE